MRSVTVSVILATLLVAALGVRSARAEVESESVQQGVAAYDNLEFARAVEILNRALTESLTREEKIVTFRTLAFAYAALGRTDDARASFARLLRLDGNAELDRSVAPKVRALFEEARAQVATGKAEPSGGGAVPTLRPHVSPAQPKEGQPVTITVVHSGGLARSVHLFHRVRGEESYSEVKTAGQRDRFELTVPGTAVRPPALEYYVTALNDENVAMGRAGTLADPLRVDVLPAKKSLRRRAWIWGVVGGAVVVAGGVATALALTLPRSDSKVADVMLIAPQ